MNVKIVIETSSEINLCKSNRDLSRDVKGDPALPSGLAWMSAKARRKNGIPARKACE
jgi:hypothetical protein